MPMDKWRHGIYSEWVFTGLVIAVPCTNTFTDSHSLAVIVWFIIPESPRWHAERGNVEKSKKILTYINGKVEGYDVEHEYAVIAQEIQQGRELSGSKGISILSVFRGTNLVSTLTMAILPVGLTTSDVHIFPLCP
jgi:hypothetical protein